MQEPNYLEIVAVPVLQRKCQELFNSNMILETNLHVELTKNRHLTEELAKVKSNLDSASFKLVSDESTMRNALTQANASIADLEEQLATAKSKIFELESSLKASSRTASKRPAVVELIKDDF